MAQTGYGLGGPPPPSAAVDQQPSHDPSQVTTMAAVQQQPWTYGIFDCWDDKKTTACGLCCMPCACVMLVKDLDEFLGLPCLVPNWLVAIRTKLRVLLNIKGSMLEDTYFAVSCFPCLMVQTMREVKRAKDLQLL